MKTNRFDDILRRKLQSIEPPYHESDWERMQSFIESKHPPTFWQRYGQAVLYGSGVAVITGLLITNITQLDENKRLLTEIKTVSQQVARQQKTIAIQRQIDTVFVTKYVDKTKIQPSIELNSETALGMSRVNGFDIGTVARNVEPNQSQFEGFRKEERRLNVAKAQNLEEHLNVGKVQNLANVGVSSFAGQGEPSGRLNVGKAANRGTIHSTNVGLNQSQTEQERLNVGMVQNLVNVGVTGLKQPNLANVEPIQSIKERVTGSESMNIEPLEPTEIVDLETDLADNVRNKKLKVRRPDELVWPTDSKKVRPVQLAHLPFRLQLGLSGSLENRLTGGGLSAEVLMGKHWSLNVGIDAVKIAGTNFLSDEQFNKKSKQEFRDLYAPRIPPTADILNINSSLEIVRMPVFLSYRYPIRKDFDFIISAGSEFDLSVKENITFNFRPTRQEFDIENRNETRNVPFFNNLVGGLGVEKRWNRLVAQFVPYLGYKTDKTPTSPNHEERDSRPQVGIRLRVMYRLGG
jgi:hypothetical protein